MQECICVDDMETAARGVLTVLWFVSLYLSMAHPVLKNSAQTAINFDFQRKRRDKKVFVCMLFLSFEQGDDKIVA